MLSQGNHSLKSTRAKLFSSFIFCWNLFFHYLCVHLRHAHTELWTDQHFFSAKIKSMNARPKCHRPRQHDMCKAWFTECVRHDVTSVAKECSDRKLKQQQKHTMEQMSIFQCDASHYLCGRGARGLCRLRKQRIFTRTSTEQQSDYSYNVVVFLLHCL